VDYTKFEDRKDMRKIALNDRTLPKNLREVLKDDEIWAMFKPTGVEINFLRDTFSRLGEGSVSAYRDALRAVREFTEKPPGNNPSSFSALCNGSAVMGVFGSICLNTFVICNCQYLCDRCPNFAARGPLGN
jgi:hypothetical protein